MIGSSNMRRVALTGALAILVGACGGASSTAAPTAAAGASQAAASQAPAPASQAAASQAAASEAAASPDTGGMANAISALSDLTSYKIKLALASKGTTSGLGAMGDITMEGTVVLKPEKASDITAMGIRMVEVNGKQYVDMGSGLTESTDSGGSSMADSLSPEKILGGLTSYLAEMKSLGDEQKNGIATTHYQADDKVLADAAAGLAMLGLTDAKWSWDVWIAKEGGYAVSYIMQGTGSDSATFSISLDISDVNSPTNVVKGP